MDDVIHVLHVDDNRELADLVSLYLERERDDLSVTSVFDAESALDELDGGYDVDCVVTDYDMPGKDGVELLREIRSDHPDLPVILFTGKGNEEVASDAVSAGVTEYMQKGTNPEQYVVLANRIYNVATAYRTTRKLHNARQQYRQLVEHAPNAILVVQDGRVVFANRTVRDWNGSGDILGTRLERLVDHESLVIFRQTIRRALSRDTPVGWQPGRLNHQFDGRHVEFNAASIRHEARDAVQLVIRDVSDEHQRARTLEALLEATRELIEAEETEDVYRIITETATDVLDSHIRASGDTMPRPPHSSRSSIATRRYSPTNHPRSAKGTVCPGTPSRPAKPGSTTPSPTNPPTTRTHPSRARSSSLSVGSGC